jgi:hypothetical protein
MPEDFFDSTPNNRASCDIAILRSTTNRWLTKGMQSNMKTTESVDRKRKVGDTIDSWCGKCKLVLAHTIEAMVGEKPARVHCNTCNAQHTYKPNGLTSSTRTEAKTHKLRTTRHEKLLQESKTAARAYSANERFAPGDVMQHAIFGLGVATAVKDGNKVEVLFESGSKLLVHDRA